MTENAVVDRGDNLPEPEELKNDPAPTPEPEPKEPEPKEPEPKEPEDKQEDDKPRDDKGRFIPVDRHKTILEKEREAREATERELQELKKQLAQVDKNADVEKIEAELLDMTKARDKALMDGELDKAAELASQIRVKERALNVHNDENLTAQIKEQMREEIRWETTIEKLESTYEVLNPKHENFDEDIVDLILAKQRVNVSEKHMSPSQALLAAAETVMRKFSPPKSEPKEEPKGLDAGRDTMKDRKEAQLAKNIDAAKKQPPDMSDVGMDSDKAGMTKDIDVSKLTSEEWANLPAATKARLRGDLL